MYVQRIDLLTRLELFLRRNGIQPFALAKASGYARQHLLRVRLGESLPTRRLVETLVEVCSELTRDTVTADSLFEGGDELLRGSARSLRTVFADDIRRLTEMLSSADSGRIELVAPTNEFAVRELLRYGARKIDADPTVAAAILAAAATIVEQLENTPAELAASLRAHALSRRASALRHLGRYDEAKSLLVASSSLFLRASYCVNEAGRADWTLATILFKQERWLDARTLAQRARMHFVQTNDTRSASRADLLLACVLFEEGNTDAARDIWLRLQSVLDDLGDYDSLARVWLNLGAAELRRQQQGPARQYLTYAGAAFRAAGMSVEVIRTQWNIANYVAAFRRRDVAINLLRRVQEKFERAGVLHDAARAGLDALELMAERPLDDAELADYGRSVANVLVSAGLSVSAATALDQLRQIARRRDRHSVIADARRAVRITERPGAPPAATTRTTSAANSESKDGSSE